jgi:cytochrome c-type biogenesis protein CcmE
VTGAVTPTRNKPRLRYFAVAGILVAAFGFLLYQGLGSALNYYETAQQAVASRATLGNSTVNVEGIVKPGSVHPTASGVDFVLTSGPVQLAVHNTGSPPQLFQPNIPVIAVGHFSGERFVSDQILVKHSSNYIAAHPGRVTAPNGTKR